MEDEMLTLFHNRYSRSAPVRWALEELQAPYELAEIASRGDYVKHSFAKAHPLMLMPTLVDDGQPVFETAAICLYLADKYGKMAPPISDLAQRGLHYQWCVFAVTELDRHADELRRLVSVEPEVRDETRINWIAGKLAKRCAMLNDHFLQREHVLGEMFSMADILLAYNLEKLKGFGLLNDTPALLGYLDRLRERPAAVRARGDTSGG
jgi:glutathione S-transferase